VTSVEDFFQKELLDSAFYHMTFLVYSIKETPT
jgi:hypothetical protein